MGVPLRLIAAVVVFLLAASPALAGSGGVCFDCEKPEPAEPEVTAEVLTLRELRALSRDVGFRRPKVAAAIAMAESSGVVRAVNRNPLRKPDYSVDRGLFQINSYWHPEVRKSCAFDARCNAEEAYRISDGGRDWRQWTTWHSGAYKAYL
jgi:hypothetical protein